MEDTLNERIEKIEKRLTKLELIEKRRQLLGIIRLIFTIIISIALLVSVYLMYNVLMR